MTHYWGTIRIKNPKTLKRWINNGNFQEKLDEGYDFYVGCGRFRTEPCTCYRCRKGRGKKLKEVLERHFKEY